MAFSNEHGIMQTCNWKRIFFFGFVDSENLDNRSSNFEAYILEIGKMWALKLVKEMVGQYDNKSNNSAEDLSKIHSEIPESLNCHFKWAT